MKILFINRYFHPDISATSQLLGDLAFHMAAEPGRSIEVVTSRQLYDRAEADLPAFERISGVVIRRVWTSRFGRKRLMGRAIDYLTFYLSALICLTRWAGRGDIIVAETDPPLISVVAALAAWLRGAKLVNWVQDLFPEVASAAGMRGLGGILGGVMRRLRNASLKAAWRNVVLGKRMAARLCEEGVAAERIEIIHNWADGQSVAPLAPADNPLRRAWGLEGRFVVGYSGNLGRAHEAPTFLDAAQELQASPEIVFLFIGGGHNRLWLEAEAARRGLSNLCFQPYQPRALLPQSLCVPDVHLISLLPEMEGLIVPSKFYGIAAAGRPMLFVGDPHGEIAGLLAHHHCGAAVAPGDGQALARHILEFKHAQHLRDSCGRSARLLLMTRFERKLALASWTQLLDAVAVDGVVTLQQQQQAPDGGWRR